MKIPIFITVQDDDRSECGRDCPFLRVDACQLFGVDLEKTKLADGSVWNDCEATRQRCYDCERFDD